MGYTTATWLGFGEVLAAVAGALTGLLFVALSVKSDVLAASRSLSSRAAETLVLFMISVLIAVFLVAPQPPVALGAELLALAVVSGITLFVLDRRAGHASDQGVAALGAVVTCEDGEWRRLRPLGRCPWGVRSGPGRTVVNSTPVARPVRGLAWGGVEGANMEVIEPPARQIPRSR